MRTLLAMICLALSLTGCLAYGEALNRAYGLDCSQATLQQHNGRCVPTAQKGT